MSTLNILKDICLTEDYFGLYKVFGNGNFREWDWQHCEQYLDNDLKLLWQFFLVRKEVRHEDIRSVVPEEVLQILAAKGIVVITEESIRSNYNLISYLDVVGFAKPGVFGHPYYLDALYQLISNVNLNHKNYLSLHPVSQFDALYAASKGGRVTVAINDVNAEEVLEVNCEMNSISSLDSIRMDDLMTTGQRFSRIASICPSLVLVPDFSLSSDVNGGPRGDQELIKSISSAARLLETDE